MDFEDRLRDMLTGKAMDIPEEADMPPHVRPRYRWRIARNAALGVVIIGLLTSGAALTSVYVSDGRGHRGPGLDTATRAPTPVESSKQCPEEEPPRGGSRWTSPVVEIGTGNNAGREWIMCAQTVVGGISSEDALEEFEDDFNSEESRQPDEPSSDESTGSGGQEGLCIYWSLGSEPGGGFDCYYREGQAELGSDMWLVFLGENESRQINGFNGPVPSNTDSAEIRYLDADGEALSSSATDAGYQIEIVDAPEELGVEFKFIVAFMEEPASYVAELVLRDDTGEVIKRRAYNDDPAEVKVIKIADGHGTVTAIDSAGNPMPNWIECGDRCSAVLPAGRYLFKAEVAEGSLFEGWGHDCIDRHATYCEIFLTYDQMISATFVLPDAETTP
jgi:hypothetical protein